VNNIDVEGKSCCRYRWRKLAETADGHHQVELVVRKKSTKVIDERAFYLIIDKLRSRKGSLINVQRHRRLPI